jgi:hypothetical protein
MFSSALRLKRRKDILQGDGDNPAWPCGGPATIVPALRLSRISFLTNDLRGGSIEPRRKSPKDS